MGWNYRVGRAGRSDQVKSRPPTTSLCLNVFPSQSVHPGRRLRGLPYRYGDRSSEFRLSGQPPHLAPGHRKHQGEEATYEHSGKEAEVAKTADPEQCRSMCRRDPPVPSAARDTELADAVHGPCVCRKIVHYYATVMCRYDYGA